MKTIKKTKEKKIKLTRHRRVIIKSSLRATITYNKKVANRFHDLKYYEVAAEEVLELPLKRHRKEELESRKQKFLNKRLREINTLMPYALCLMPYAFRQENTKNNQILKGHLRKKHYPRF